MNKLLRLLHRWLGLSSGFVILFVAITGAVLVFQSEILRAINRDDYFATNSGELLAVSEIVTKIKTVDGYSIEDITIYEDKNAYIVAGISIDGERRSLFIDPYTAAVVEVDRSSAFFSTVTRLHRNLLLSRTGKMIVGVATLVFVFMLIAGITRKIKVSKKKAFLIDKRKISRYFSLWQLHTVLGLFVSVPLLIMALTGLFWSFAWYRTAAVSLCDSFIAAPAPDKITPMPQINIPLSERFTYEALIAEFDHIYDGIDYIKVSVVESDGDSIKISVKPRNTLLGRYIDSYIYDLESRLVVEATYYKDIEFRKKAGTFFKAFHTGSWGGMATKITYFISVLVCAFIIFSGYWMFVIRKKKR